MPPSFRKRTPNAPTARATRASAGVAALYRRGCGPGDGAAAAGRLRPADSRDAGRHRGVHQRRPSAGIGVRARPRRGDRTRRCSLAAILAASAARAARSRRPSPKPTCCSSSPPTAIACTRPMTTARCWRASSTKRRRRRQSRSSRRSRSGRVEELLYWIKPLEDRRAIPDLPVYVDSPMASAVLVRVPQAGSTSWTPTSSRHGRGDTARMPRPSAAWLLLHGQAEGRDLDCRDHAPCRTPKKPSIVISSSGMATGGRVLHHLERALPDARNTVLFAGYQAAGTRGRALKDGAQVRPHSRPGGAGACADCGARLDVRARRRERNPALARRLQAAARR